MNDMGERFTGFIAAIIALATLAIVISFRSNTVAVARAFFGGTANLIGVAISPITGNSVAGLDASGLTGGQWAPGGSSGTAYGGSYYGSAGGGVSVGLPSGAGFNISGGAVQSGVNLIGQGINAASSYYGGGGLGESGTWD